MLNKILKINIFIHIWKKIMVKKKKLIINKYNKKIVKKKEIIIVMWIIKYKNKSNLQ